MKFNNLLRFGLTDEEICTSWRIRITLLSGRTPSWIYQISAFNFFISIFVFLGVFVFNSLLSVYIVAGYSIFFIFAILILVLLKKYKLFSIGKEHPQVVNTTINMIFDFGGMGMMLCFFIYLFMPTLSEGWGFAFARTLILRTVLISVGITLLMSGWLLRKRIVWVQSQNKFFDKWRKEIFTVFVFLTSILVILVFLLPRAIFYKYFSFFGVIFWVSFFTSFLVFVFCEILVLALGKWPFVKLKDKKITVLFDEQTISD